MSAIFDVECIVDDLSPLALAVLFELGDPADFGCHSFATLSRRCYAEWSEIKAAVGELKQHGLVEFWRSTMTEDGEVSGAAYSASEDGLRLQNIVSAVEQAKALIGDRALLRKIEERADA